MPGKIARSDGHAHALARFREAAQRIIAAKDSLHTRRAYSADLERWVSFCRARSVEPFAPGLDAATAYKDSLGASLSRDGVRRALSLCSAIYRTLREIGTVTVNPFHPSLLAWPKAIGYGRTALVSEDDAAKVIAVASADETPHGRRDLAVLLILYMTGTRRASVASMLRRAIDRTQTPPRIVVRLKGGKLGMVELLPRVMDAIDGWLAVAPESPYVFPGDGTDAMAPGTVNLICAARAKDAGVPHVHPHQFRAAFVTLALKSPEVQPQQAQGAAGHAHISTTQGYGRGAMGAGVAAAVDAMRKGRT